MALMKALQLPMGCSLSNVTLFRNLANKIELINYKNFKNCSLFVATGIFSASRLLFYAVVNFLTAHPAKFCPWCLTDNVSFLRRLRLSARHQQVAPDASLCNIFVSMRVPKSYLLECSSKSSPTSITKFTIYILKYIILIVVTTGS